MLLHPRQILEMFGNIFAPPNSSDTRTLCSKILGNRAMLCIARSMPSQDVWTWISQKQRSLAYARTYMSMQDLGIFFLVCAKLSLCKPRGFKHVGWPDLIFRCRIRRSINRSKWIFSPARETHISYKFLVLLTTCGRSGFITSLKLPDADA